MGVSVRVFVFVFMCAHVRVCVVAGYARDAVRCVFRRARSILRDTAKLRHQVRYLFYDEDLRCNDPLPPDWNTKGSGSERAVRQYIGNNNNLVQSQSSR